VERYELDKVLWEKTMIEWTTHFKFLGFTVQTCDYGGRYIWWKLGNFNIGYSRDPDFSKMEKV
jgi:hypothetical protein